MPADGYFVLCFGNGAGAECDETSDRSPQTATFGTETRFLVDIGGGAPIDFVDVTGFQDSDSSYGRCPEGVDRNQTSDFSLQAASPGETNPCTGPLADGPTISVADATITEGNSGTDEMTFTVTVANPGSAPIAFTASTSDDTAVAGADYTAIDQLITIAGGQSTTAVVVPIIGDTLPEPTETFDLTLSTVTGGTFADPAAVGTINDSDAPLPPMGAEVISVPTGDATATSVAFAQLTNPGETKPDSAPAVSPDEVLVASDAVFADALASGSLQGTRPLLLNSPTELEPAVLAEITRLGTTNVRVLGGDAAIRDSVVAEMEAAGLTVVRTFGPTRLETAEQIAQIATAPTTTILARAFPAPGGDDTQAFADSLAAGGWSAFTGWPVTLTQSEVLSTTTRTYLEGSMIDTARVVGGTAAISDAVIAGLTELDVTSERASGPTRFATATELASARGFSSDVMANAVIVVEGQAANAWEAGFTSAGASAALNAPVVLANGDGLPEPTEAFLADSVDPIDGRTALICAASPAACEAAAAALGLDG